MLGMPLYRKTDFLAYETCTLVLRGRLRFVPSSHLLYGISLFGNRTSRHRTVL